MMKSRLQAMCDEKINQWNKEALINAMRAHVQGIEAWEVEYPTGLKMMRFAQPFTEFGMHYEVTPEAWEYVLAGGGLR